MVGAPAPIVSLGTAPAADGPGADLRGAVPHSASTGQVRTRRVAHVWPYEWLRDTGVVVLLLGSAMALGGFVLVIGRGECVDAYVWLRQGILRGDPSRARGLDHRRHRADDHRGYGVKSALTLGLVTPSG